MILGQNESACMKTIDAVGEPDRARRRAHAPLSRYAFPLVSILLWAVAGAGWPATIAQAYYPKGTAPGDGGWYDLRGIEIPVIYSDRMIKRKKLDIPRLQPERLLQLNAKDVIAGVGKKPPVYYFEWKHIKFVCQFPTINLAIEMAPKTPRERRNWEFMKQEIEDLRRVFPKAKLGTMNGHQIAHLVMNRLVRFYKKFEKEMRFWDEVKGIKLADYGMGPHLGQRAPFEIFVLKKRNYFKWEDRFIGRKSIAGQKWNLMEDGALTFACYYDGPFPRFNNHLHHNFAQILLWGYRFWSFKLPGWIQMGFGHYIEREITPRYNSFDYDEAGAEGIPKSWRFKKRIYKLVVGKKTTPFAELKGWIQPSEFSGNDFQQIWSMTEFLIAHDRDRYRDFLILISKKVDQDQALKKAFGWSFNVFEERWKDYVRKNYPPR